MPHALTADKAWYPFIERATGARAPTVSSSWCKDELVVDSVYTSSLNIVSGDRLLSLLTHVGRRSPGAMITSLSDFSAIHPGAFARISRDLLIVDHLVIDLSQLVYFDCRVTSVKSLSSNPLSAHRTLLKAITQPDSFTIETDDTPFRRALTTKLIASREQFRSELGQAIATCETNPTVLPSTLTTLAPLDLAVGGLIGLGFGLTPTGDDYLVGTLAALTILDLPWTRFVRNALASCVVSRVCSSMTPVATTLVSRHFLQAACRGEFHQDLAWAGHAVLSGSDSASEAITRAAAVGSSSGADTLLGFLDTIEIAIETLERSPWVN